VICVELLQKNPALIPKIRLEKSNSKLSLLMHLPGSPGSTDDQGEAVWIRLNDFTGSRPSTSSTALHKVQLDILGQIMTTSVQDLSPIEQDVKYFVLCLELYAQLALGRNQQALGLLISDPDRALQYNQVLEVLLEESLPAILRAKYVTLVVHLFLDRVPFSRQPLVQYTRIATGTGLVEHSTQHTSHDYSLQIPGCTDNFVKLLDKLQIILKNMGSNVLDLSFGQVELLSQFITLAYELLNFGFLVFSDGNSSKPDYSRVTSIFESLFLIIASKASSEKIIFDLRTKTLNCLQCFFGLRSNLRISVATQSFCKLFPALDWKGQDSQVFQSCERDINDLLADLFQRDILSHQLKIDSYVRGNHGDQLITNMFRLCQNRDPGMSHQAISLVLRNMSQRSRNMQTLEWVQLLVSEEEVTVFRETEHINRTLTLLRREVSQSNTTAYKEVRGLLQKLTARLRNQPPDILLQNRTIMLNLEVHKNILNNYVQGLVLSRDRSRRDGGTVCLDTAKDPDFRNVLQDCYDFLLEFTRDNAKAQQDVCRQVFNVVQLHIGVEELNVVDTLVETLRDRPDLWVLVQDTICEQMVAAIKVYGRRHRWLQVLQVFCQVKGVSIHAVKTFQLKIFRLLLHDKELLIDLECDYRNSPLLPANDARYGKTRVDLIRMGDYKGKYFSLVQYHVASLDLLSLCCSGKNRVNQAACAQVIPLSVILDNILKLDPRNVGDITDCDSLYFVKTGWMCLLFEVYLQSGNSARQCRIVQNSHQIIVSTSHHCLMKEISTTMGHLAVRLTKIKSSLQSGGDHIANLSGKQDDEGEDLLRHVQHAQMCASAAEKLVIDKIFFVDHDDADSSSKQQESKMVENDIVTSFGVLQNLLEDFPASSWRKFSTTLAQVLACLKTGGDISSPAKNSSVISRSPNRVPDKTTQFNAGWTRFRSYLADCLHVSSNDGRSTDAEIQDVALLFGSKRVACNEELQSLQEMMKLLCKEDEMDVMLLEAGLRVLRAILYLNPDELSTEQQQKEYNLCLQNRVPSDVRNAEPRFTKLQTEMARKGAVEVVGTCLSNQNKDVIEATLQLAVVLVDGGNESVQALFHDKLNTNAGQSFFKQLNSLFDNAVIDIKETKQRNKRREKSTTELEKAGVYIGNDMALEQNQDTETTSQKLMTEVMKMMRRLMLRNKHMQNLFRFQRFNCSSFDFLIQSYQYLTALEPQLKESMRKGLEDRKCFETVEVFIRGFRMLTVALQGPNTLNQKSLARCNMSHLYVR